jgi:hypothetical protein
MKRMLFAIGALAMLAGCGASAAPTTATVRPATATSIPDTQATPFPTAAPTPNNLEGPLGTTYTTTDQNGNSMDVTLTQIFKARPAQGEDVDNTTYIAAAKFTIKGDSGIYTDDINSDVTATGSDGTTYQIWIGEVTDCGQFSAGEYTVTPQQTVSGCALFQLPNGVTIKQVQWTASDPPGLWDN